MRAGFKRSRTRARVYSLYFRSLCPRWEHHRSVEKLEKLFLRERRGEQIFRRIFFFFFHRRSIWTIWKEKENGEGRILSGTRLDCSLPPPLPSPLLPWKTEALSLSPPSHRDNDIGERASPPPPPVHPFLSSSSSSEGSRPSPPPRRRAFSHPAIGLPSGVRRERAGTYDAIGYRISAGSLIGRSTAHGRSRSPPSYD